MDAIIQDQTKERIDFQVMPSDLPAGGLWSGMAEAAYSVDGQAPYRALVLHWSDEYGYVDSLGPFLSLRRGRAYTVGVNQVDDLAMGPNGPVARTTTYDRQVPLPYFAGYVIQQMGIGIGTTPLTDGPVVYTDPNGHLLWQSTDFHTRVTHPDGTSVLYTYAPPDFSTAVKRLAFLKAMPVTEEWLGSDGTTSRITTWSTFDLKALGDPNGTLIMTAIPHAEQWETVDALGGRKEEHTLQGWSALDAAYTTEAVTISGMNGCSPVNRTMTKSFDTQPSVFLMARVASECPTSITFAHGDNYF